MFVRSRTVKGRVYYQVVKSYRARGHELDPAGRVVELDGRVRHKILADLGTHPTLEEARRDADEKYFATCQPKRGKGGRKQLGDRKAWERLINLCRLEERQQGEAYEPDPRILAEYRRWEWAQSNAREKRTARTEREKEREREENREWFRGMFGGGREVDRETIRRLSEGLVLLGFEPLPTEGQVKAAYRRKARECHPDHGGSDEAMARLKEACDAVLKLVLGDFEGLNLLGRIPRLAGPDK